MLQNAITGLYGVCMFKFLILRNFFIKWLNNFSFLPATYEWSNFSSLWTFSFMTAFLNFNHSGRHMEVSYILNFHFLNDQLRWTYWMNLFAPYISSSVKCMIKSFCLFSNCIVWDFIVKLSELFTCSRQYSLVRYVICKYFLQVCSLFSHCLKSIFSRAKVFNFDETQLIQFFF